MKRNLGGDRIGSGAKMNVDLHGYGRSTHSLTTDIATTMSIGTLIPVHHSLIEAGDTREIDLDALLLTHPTEGPLFGSFKLQVDVFKADMRLYIGKLHMNLLEVGLQMSDIKIPQLTMVADDIDWTKDPNNQQTNPSSIFRYLHMNGPGQLTPDGGTKPTRNFNAIPWLMYWEVYKNYYANKQEKIGAVIHTGTPIPTTVTQNRIWVNDAFVNIVELPATMVPVTVRTDTFIQITYTGTTPGAANIIYATTAGDKTLYDMYQTVVDNAAAKTITGTIPKGEFVINGWRYPNGTDPINTEIRVATFPLENLDDIKMDILADIKSTTAYTINANSIAPFGWALQQNGDVWTKMQSQEGLALKTYQSDLFNNWLNTEYIDGANGINARTAIQTDADGKFTIDNFLLKQKAYDYLNRIAVAGATVDDMMEVTYDVENKTRSEIPIFEGGMSKELVFEQVISNSATDDQPLGTIAGRGATKGHKGGKLRITNNDTQHGYYMVIASLTPRLKYSQGNGWGTNLKTYEDIHKPAFDGIGFQDLITDQMAAWDTQVNQYGDTTFRSAGKQPAWINYQTEIDRVFGNFAIQTSEGWMVLDRDYEADAVNKTIKDLTTYIDPSKYNGVFAYEAIDAQNIWAQFKVEDKATRKMSANQMPNL